MNAKTKVILSPEQQTLLIPLYAKAQEGNPLFFDPKAREILGQVDYNFSQLRVPYKTVVLVCQRAKKLDSATRDFLVQHPTGFVLHLGCGLDNRFWRVDNGQVEWYDPKSTLQEWAQSNKLGTPRYMTVNASGPDHAKVFTVEVQVDGKIYGKGAGTSKQAAAQMAAHAALEVLGLD